MSKQIVIGISDLNVAKNPDILVTYALGSCVGICVFDAITGIAGMAHIMLPSSKEAIAIDNRMKFADTCIVDLINKLEHAGAKRIRMKAKIAGGAQMFATMQNSSISNIGQRNIQATKQALLQLGIPIVAEDVGFNYGRTVYFYSQTGIMKVKSVNRGEWEY